MTALLAIAERAILLVLVALDLAATALIVTAARADSRQRRRNELVDVEVVASSQLTTALSVIVPVQDAHHGVVQAVRRLLESAYPAFEVIVVDDGSRDGTIDALREAFSLVQVERVPRSRLRTRRVARAYASPLDARLLVLDKEPGGRADALNTGLRFARYPLVCPIDLDVSLDRDALARMAREFQTSPETIACRAGTRVMAEGRAPLARLYAFARRRDALIWRIGAERLGGTVLVRHAVTVFSREAVVAAGGYEPAVPGEDLELVLRLHRHCLDTHRRYRITALARPVGRRVAPLRLRASSGATAAPLARHRGMLLRRRYASLGCAVLPALTLWWLLRRPSALAAAVCVVAGAALGTVDLSVTLGELLLLVSAPLGLSLAGVLLDRRPAARSLPRTSPPACGVGAVLR